MFNNVVVTLPTGRQAAVYEPHTVYTAPVNQVGVRRPVGVVASSTCTTTRRRKHQDGTKTHTEKTDEEGKDEVIMM